MCVTIAGTHVLTAASAPRLGIAQGQETELPLPQAYSVDTLCRRGSPMSVGR